MESTLPTEPFSQPLGLKSSLGSLLVFYTLPSGGLGVSILCDIERPHRACPFCMRLLPETCLQAAGGREARLLRL